MNESNLRILSVEDSELDAELCHRVLDRAGLKFRSERVWTHEAYERALKDFEPDLILCDFSLPGTFDGFTALSLLKETSPDTPFIFVSGTIGEERAVEALKRGATDYVLKDRLERLVPVVRRALQESMKRVALQHAQMALRESEERFRQMAENISDVFFLFDARAHRVLYVSPAYETIWAKAAPACMKTRTPGAMPSTRTTATGLPAPMPTGSRAGATTSNTGSYARMGRCAGSAIAPSRYTTPRGSCSALPASHPTSPHARRPTSGSSASTISTPY